jgi:hypothetical protein
MTNTNGHDEQGNREHKVTSLRDLPQAVEPPRDLWAAIQARIVTEGKITGAAGSDAHGDAGTGSANVTSIRGRSSSSRHLAQMRWMAAAAVIVALAVGIWIGRSALPTTRPITIPSGSITTPHTPTVNSSAQTMQAAYLSDPKFRQQRAALAKSLEAKLASLPPDSRAKVISSLATIHQSMQDLEAALGKDPTNALLQELLVNTYQDEMRVLTTVHETSDAGKGI